MPRGPTLRTANEQPKESPDTPSVAGRLQEIVSGSWQAQAIYVAAELRIADLLAGGPRTSADLAQATGADEASLHRLLRALSTIDICREHADGSFSIMPMGALLGADRPDSLRSWAIWWGAYLWPVWGHLLYSVKTGESARKKLFGSEGFEHLERDRQAAEVFNEAFREVTRLACQGIVQAYDFSGMKQVADIGGGYGQLLVAILRAYPETTGILFDLSHAIDRASRETSLGARCNYISGDFTQNIPPGADAYILKNVIHDWNDERARCILENCRRVMNADARLLVIERILPEHLKSTASDQTAVRSDLTMLIAHSGRERTEAEYRDLLDTAGFRVTRIIPTVDSLSIIEARPA